MLIGIPKESAIGERRVATSPDAATQLQKLGYDVCIESGAGDESKFRNSDYESVGVKIVNSKEEIYKTADIILKVREPEETEQKIFSIAGSKSHAVAEVLPATRTEKNTANIILFKCLFV